VHRFVLHNQEIREASDKLLSPGQVGLLSGWGVFTTIRVTEGVLFAWERHWARMAKDAVLLHVTLPPDPNRVQELLLKLVEANRACHSTMRVVVVRNCGGIWEGPPAGRSSDLIALTADSKIWGEAVKLTYKPQARHSGCVFAGAKILSWAMNLTWLEEAQAKGFDEVILLNDRGEVSECTSANIFVARGNEVWTPPLSSGCLPGITRELLLSEIRIPGLRVGEKTLHPADLEQADDVFITSTTRGLLPVFEIDGKPLKRSERDRAALQQGFSEYVDRYVAEHKQQPVSSSVQ